jgi:pimeloyl-ACP methyl ester carboxylesterase
VAEAGPASGEPLFLFHGFGASRLCLHPDEGICERLGVRLIAVDRPGIGLSDAVPSRQVIDWADDVRYLADVLGLSRFGVLGWSAGGAYALAVGAAMASRVKTIGVISGVAPARGQDRFGGSPLPIRVAEWLNRVAPAISLAALRRVQNRIRHGYPALLAWSTRWLSPADRELIAIPEIAETLRTSALEAFRGGSDGIAADAASFAADWGFRLHDVSVPVQLWHGEQDTIVPADTARHNARLLPQASLVTFRDDGHLLYFRRWQGILQWSIAAGAASHKGQIPHPV